MEVVGYELDKVETLLLASNKESIVMRRKNCGILFF
jgi:hypothetical protein